MRKLNSILAGTASAVFSLALGQVAVFDCRIVPLPSVERVCDYFLWRQEDASRNALNSHCYWAMRKAGRGANDADEQIKGRSIAEKKALLLDYGVDFTAQPAWQTRGFGVWWENVEKPGFNPITGENVVAIRRSLHVEYELPTGRAYGARIQEFFSSLEP